VDSSGTLEGRRIRNKMIIDYFLISFNNLRRRKLRSWLTIIGILIGIASVVSLISVGDGLRAAVNSQFGVSSTEVITIQAGGLNSFGPPGSGAVNSLQKDDSDAIERLGSVESAIPRNIATIKIEYNDILEVGIAGSVIGGEKRKLIYELLEVEAESGRLLKDGDNNKIVLGHDYSLDTNTFEKGLEVGNRIKLNGESFEVVGIAKKKGSFILDSVIWVNDEPLERLANYGDDVDLIVVKVKGQDLMMQAQADIEKVLRKRRDVKVGEEDFEVSTPAAALETVNQVLLGVQLFIAMIALISVVVGAIGIINTMTTSVLERKKQIGIMKAIGARNKDIFYLFFIESGLMGLIGGIIGVTIGVIVGYIGTIAINQFIGADVQPTIQWGLVVYSLIGSFVLGSISGIWPALSAAKKKPVEALKG